MEFLVAAGSLLWIALILLPWQPWRTRERLELKVEPGVGPDLSDVTVLIPARNEAAGINDIHFVPGNPRFFMGGLAWYF